MKKLMITLVAMLATLLPGGGQELLHKQAPAVPDYVVFAGDTVRLDRDDRYERMDRELMAFTYMHTTSYLMLKRADRVFTQVVPILRKNGIPEDLKYLMVIESNLDPKAVSVTGAGGLWQFTKATAGEFGMEISADVDERFNIEKETEAACRYLKQAYAKYGDWMTVAASYNAGQGGISKALAAQQQRSALDLWLKEETSRYMFRLLTCKLFLENPEPFGFHLREGEAYPYRKPARVVEVKTSIPSLADFAAKEGTTFFRLKEANLWLKTEKLSNPSGKTYRIVIPGD